MKKVMKRVVAFCIVSVLFSLAGKCFGAPTESSESVIDSLEWKLELDRHKQLVTIKQQPENSLEPFTTDGCSGGLSIGWHHLSDTIDHIKEIHGDLPPWESCCVTHDRAYHTAGPEESEAEDSFRARRTADEQLRKCVRETGFSRAPELSAEYGLSPEEVQRIYAVIGTLMFRAVRLGGVPCSGLPWRWGYGWPECE